MGMRAIGRLSALKVKGLSEPGRYCDGGGLYLQVCSSGSKSWIFRYQLNKRVRDMGLGSAAVIGLADARDPAGQCRALVARQIDPVDERRKKQLLAAANAASFEECSRRCFQQKRLEWRNEKHTKQWMTTLEQYAFPVLGKVSVREVETPLVLRVCVSYYLNLRPELSFNALLLIFRPAKLRRSHAQIPSTFSVWRGHCSVWRGGGSC
jgi:hypothetical protein